MTEQPYTFETTYQNVPVSRVWKALTDKDKMKQWYFDLPEFEPEVGFQFTFYGKGKEGEDYLHLCKIFEVILEKKLTYSWQYDDFDGISFVTFDLFEEGNNTRVKLTHQGLESFPSNNASFAKESFAEGWTMLLGTLLRDFVADQKDHVET